MKKSIFLVTIVLFTFLASSYMGEPSHKSIHFVQLPDCKYDVLYTPPLSGCTKYSEQTVQNGSYYTHVTNWSCGIYGNINNTCTDQKAGMPSPPQE